MQELPQKMNPVKLANVDQILFHEKLFDIKRNFKYEHVFNDMKKNFHHLFDQIDWNLKHNKNLNKYINAIVEYNTILNFDLKNYFNKKDENGRVIFDKLKYEEAKKFFREWPIRKIQIESELTQTESKKHFKFLHEREIIKLRHTLDHENYRYNCLKEIFDLEKTSENINRPRLQKKVYELEEKTYSIIDSVTDKYIIDSLKDNPEIMLIKIVYGGKYYIMSSAFLSNKNNKNLEKFFNSESLTNRLDEYCNNYIATKKNDLSSGENSLSSDTQDNGYEKGNE